MKTRDFSPRHFLRKKELKNIDEALSDYYDHDFSLTLARVEKASSDNLNILIMDKTPMFFQHEGSYFLTLKGLERYPVETKYATVDMGAIPYLVNGADVMAPGIVDACDTIRPGDVIWIRDKAHLKPIAVGKAKRSGDDLVALSKGKVVENLHYVGDELWELDL